MATWNYVASIHKPTGVPTSTCCSLTDSNTRNLVIGRNNRIEVHTIREDGIYPEKEIPVFGSVRHLDYLKDPATGLNLLIMHSHPHRISLIQYTPNEILTKDYRDFQDIPVSRIAIAPKYTKDPYNRCICLMVEKGYIDVVPISTAKSAFKHPFKARVEDYEIRAFCLLKTVENPTLAIHYFHNGQSFVKVYEVKLGASKSLEETEWCFNTEDSLNRGLISLDAGNLCVLTQHALFIHSRTSGSDIFNKEAEIGEVQAITEVSENRFVLGNMKGDFIFLYFLENNVEVQRLGSVSIPTSISYLDNNYFFIGSSYGDSQVIKVLSEESEGSFVAVQQTYDNIAPISDFKMLNFERYNNQRELLTCSGYKQHGSLRFIRKGISLNIEAETEVGKCNGLWSLKDNYTDPKHSMLLLSYLNETKLLRMENETVQEFCLSGMDYTSTTIYAANTLSGILQVTHTSIHLITPNSTVSSISASNIVPNGRISLASSFEDICAVVINGVYLYTLSLSNDSISISNMLQVTNEIACLGLSKDIVMIGQWVERAVKILSVHSLSDLWVDLLEEDMLPRSVLLCNMDGIRYLFVGLGDGHLVTYSLPEFEKKTLAIGSQNIFLNEFIYEGRNHVFIGCDCPTVIYSLHQRLQLANVNLPKVTAMAHFISEDFPRCLSFICEDKLVMTSIEDIQKLSISTRPLKMTVRRIGFLDDYLVILSASNRKHSLLLLSQFDQRKLSRVELPENEKGAALGVWNDLVILGSTDPAVNNEKDIVGYLRVYKVSNGGFLFLKKLEVEGTPLCIKPMDGYLATGIKNYMIVWKRDMVAELKEVARSTKFTYVACCDTYENYIAAADLIKSITVLKLVNEELKYVSKNFSTLYIIDVCLVNADTIIAVDQFFNIMLMQNQGNMRLEITRAFYLGDQVNCLRRGTISYSRGKDFTDNLDTILYGTVNGALGIIATLPDEIYLKLSALQTVLASRYTGVGGISIQQYRTNSLTVKRYSNLDWLGFIDGDFIDMYFELKPVEQDTVAMLVSERTGLKISHQDIQKILISLSKIH